MVSCGAQSPCCRARRYERPELMNDFLGRSGAYERFVHKLHFYTGFELVICSSTKPVDGAIVHKLKSFISSILCGASREWIFSFCVIRVFGTAPPLVPAPPLCIE
ncbi:hypothetical protein COLSTE_00003 [Collinsella stercoris DSM 13279]|uniref:Uncharacterized protein n=1 Tax=Collinsella stercoris DSM 13279 TaxID=445975 RepID=B6G7G4_9ACTN|nr:hypothetical protein COLSTE_00003 [Collinsella stercoris DSM 13279]